MLAYLLTTTYVQVVNCLSKTIRDDIVTENTLRVSKGCRKQVRNLLLAKLQLETGISDAQSIYKMCRYVRVTLLILTTIKSTTRHSCDA